MRTQLAKLTPLLFLLFFGNSMVFAQTSILGQILDEKSEPLAYASIVLMSKADSSAVQFTMSDPGGNFSMKGIKKGNYILQTLYNGYSIDNRSVVVSESSDDIKLGSIKLAPSTLTLKEAMVVAKKIPMVFKGDTIIYNPSAFNTKTNATVEDLLKKLPGVQINSDGSVTAQGENVVKVLVNGKEFFGNDPTKATQNINADAIEKVEVLDQKSDAAEFTGVDDGNRDKVINLVLKEDANKGFFGKVEAGAGTEETYRTKAVLNRFKDENQYTLIANANNLNQNGFNWREYYNMLNGSGGVNLGQQTYWYSQNQWLGENQEGRQQNAVLGANAHLKIGKKGELDASYFMMDRSNDLIANSVSENYLPDRTILGNIDKTSKTTNGQHKGIAHYEWKPDTLNFISSDFEVDYTFGGSDEFETFVNRTLEGKLLSNSIARANAWRNNINLKGQLMYYRKFSKNKNTLMLMTGGEHNEGRDTTKWANMLEYTELDMETSLPYQLQDQIYGTGDVIFNRASFNYHIKGDWYGQSGLENKLANNTYSQGRFNIPLEMLVGSQSPEMSTFTSTSKAELGFAKNRKKRGEGWYLNFNLHGVLIDLQREVDLEGFDQTNYSSRKFFLYPNGYISYHKPKSFRSGFWFNGSPNMPNVTQVNPVMNIVNPMRLSSGNFQLDPTISYNAGMHLNSRNPGKSSFWYGNFNTGIRPNDFIRSENRDSNNVSTTTWVNGGESSWFNFNLNHQFEISKLHLKIGNSARYSYFGYISILNDNEYMNNRSSISYNFDIGFQLDMLEIGFEYSPQYTIQNSELLTQNITFWRHNFASDLSWDITEKVELSTDFNVFYFNTQQVGAQQAVPILNGGIEWKIDSTEQWAVSLIAYDMLGKAQSINRNFFNNTFSEIRQNTLTRYFMFNVTYSIKRGKKKQERNRYWEG